MRCRCSRGVNYVCDGARRFSPFSCWASLTSIPPNLLYQRQVVVSATPCWRVASATVVLALLSFRIWTICFSEKHVLFKLTPSE